MKQLHRWRRWLEPGIGIKRWIALQLLGIALTVVGLALVGDALVLPLLGWAGVDPSGRVVEGPRLLPGIGGLALAVIGGVVMLVGLRGTLRSIDRVLFPTGNPTLVDVLRQLRVLQRGPRIVAIGGGTGLSTLLRGLKMHSTNITAVVTVFDDGGSSGRLRRDLGVLPPGDIRDCLVALAESEPLMTDLFEYRFPGGELNGHAFGNLFIASLAGVTGDLVGAVHEASKVLNIRGRVLPSTVENVVLSAEYEDGSVVEGESRIPREGKQIRRVLLNPSRVPVLREVIDAIEEADLIVIGPGSLYTSVIPNLLVEGIAPALRRAPAPKIYVCNVMTQPGETDGFAAQDHVRAIIDAAGGVLTHALVNTREPSPSVRRRYEAEGAYPVRADLGQIEVMGVRSIAEPLIAEQELVRHDPAMVAAAVMRIARPAARGPRLRGPRLPVMR